AQAMLQRHERANDFVLASGATVVRDGRFEAVLKLPAELPWPRLVVRAYAHTERQEGLGVRALPVRRWEGTHPPSPRDGDVWPQNSTRAAFASATRKTGSWSARTRRTAGRCRCTVRQRPS